jgi:hypothetical protein
MVLAQVCLDLIGDYSGYYVSPEKYTRLCFRVLKAGTLGQVSVDVKRPGKPLKRKRLKTSMWKKDYVSVSGRVNRCPEWLRDIFRVTHWSQNGKAHGDHSKFEPEFGLTLDLKRLNWELQTICRDLRSTKMVEDYALIWV